MTYKELADYILNNLTKEQQDQTATYYDADDDEFYPIDSTEQTIEDDVLDKNHIFLRTGIKTACIRCGEIIYVLDDNLCDYCNYITEKEG